MQTHILKDHITVTIKSLHTAQQFLVVSDIDQHLCVVLYTMWEYRQGTLGEILFVLFLLLCMSDALFLKKKK